MIEIKKARALVKATGQRPKTNRNRAWKNVWGIREGDWLSHTNWRWRHSFHDGGAHFKVLKINPKSVRVEVDDSEEVCSVQHQNTHFMCRDPEPDLLRDVKAGKFKPRTKGDKVWIMYDDVCLLVEIPWDADRDMCCVTAHIRMSNDFGLYRIGEILILNRDELDAAEFIPNAKTPPPPSKPKSNKPRKRNRKPGVLSGLVSRGEMWAL